MIKTIFLLVAFQISSIVSISWKEIFAQVANSRLEEVDADDLLSSL